MCRDWMPEDWDNPWSETHIVKRDEATPRCIMDFHYVVEERSRLDRESAYDSGGEAMFILLKGRNNGNQVD